MDIPHRSNGSFPREGPWLAKTGLVAAGLMIGVALGMSISPWSAPPPQDTVAIRPAPTGVMPAAPVASADGAQTASMRLLAPAGAPAEVQGMELCWGGDDPVRC